MNEIYIVWMQEWKAYRIYLPEHPQKSLGYTEDLRKAQEAAEKRYADRKIRIFNGDEEKVVQEPPTVRAATAEFLCLATFAAGAAFAAIIGWLASIL